jgi:phosphoribosylformylglycinamidine cyclo-ligase
MSSRYEEAGVSIAAQDEAIHRLKSHVARCQTPRVLAAVGSFGGLFDGNFPQLKNPVLVASTDGVGTKLRIAQLMGRHDTIGQCLVNHCIDDILVQGASPLFFMDYISTGKLSPTVVEEILRGMADACKSSSCAILGGELAEMPGFYQPGEYDVAGFIVGVVDRERILGASRVRPGQTLIGLPSSGLHTNGYSLARRILLEELALKPSDSLPGGTGSVGEALLAVHINYHPLLWPLLERGLIAAMAHITGGGFVDNIPRVLPDGVDVRIHRHAYEVPPLFRLLVERGRVSQAEAYKVFNMGIGMVLMVNPDQAVEVLRHCQEQGSAAVVLGETVPGERIVHLVD